MEPQTYHKLLFLSLLFISSLIIFPSANAVSYPSPVPSTEPAGEAPVGSPSSPTPVPSTEPSPSPSENHISFPPSSTPPSQPPSNSPFTNPTLENICKSTDYPDICISSIAPFLTGKIDPESVVEIAIKSAIGHTKLAASLAAKMALVPSPFASVYGDCKDSYDDALENFESAMSALVGLDVGTMNTMLSAAITNFGDCDDGLLRQSSSPLLDFDSVLIKMTSNCLAIVSLIH